MTAVFSWIGTWLAIGVVCAVGYLLVSLLMAALGMLP